mmetsp:Transcript_30392/g.92829  ORF Transcript_30392/g.92829 Transcript_30392/m.92829 type:complete len:236 (-) Transcript_30392:208-915(-)
MWDIIHTLTLTRACKVQGLPHLGSSKGCPTITITSERIGSRRWRQTQLSCRALGYRSPPPSAGRRWRRRQDDPCISPCCCWPLPRLRNLAWFGCGQRDANTALKAKVFRWFGGRSSERVALGLRFEAHLLHMVLQRDIEVKCVVALNKAHAQECVPCAVNDADHEVSAAIRDWLNGDFWVLVGERACGEERAVGWVLDPHVAMFACGDDSNTASEDVARLWPVLAAPAAGGRARW